MHYYPDMKYANVMPMINMDLIRGTRYAPEENGHGTDPLLLDILNSSEQHFVDAEYAPDIRNLCRRFPEAINCIVNNGKTALHSAAKSLVDGMILSDLLLDGVDRFGDRLLLIVDFDLTTPLSNYMQNQADPRVVDLLMDAEGVVLTMQDHFGKSPLHHIMELDADRFNLESLQSMKNKMRQYDIETTVLELQDDFGETALHFALKGTSSLLSNTYAINYIIPKLIDKKQDVLRMRNRRDMLPPED